MNARDAHHERLREVRNNYARIRVGLVLAREESLLQAWRTACVIEELDREALKVMEALRDHEGDEEFIAS
jgi:hypothetical protein